MLTGAENVCLLGSTGSERSMVETALLTGTDIGYCLTSGVKRHLIVRHSASFESSDKNAPSKPGTKHLARSIDFDVAILDVNLAGEMVTPVAQAVKSRGLPLIFATGYGAWGVPDAFRDRPALQKPFELQALAAAISSIRIGSKS